MSIVIKYRHFNIRLVAALRAHGLYSNQGSGMDTWMTSKETDYPFSWMGEAPALVAVAYDNGTPIGWCGIGSEYRMYAERYVGEDVDHRSQIVSIVATYVNPVYRQRGIAKKLLRRALHRYRYKSKILAIDESNWNCTKYIEAAGYKAINFTSYIPKELAS